MILGRFFCNYISGGAVDNIIRLLAFVAILFFGMNIGPSLAATKYEQVVVKGESRISSETIRSISGLFNNEEHSTEKINQGLKNLVSSGLFSDVEIKINGSKLTIFVTENPQISIIAFEGNQAVQDSEMFKIISLKARDALDENKVKVAKRQPANKEILANRLS